MDKEPESRHNFLQETFNKPDVFDSWNFSCRVICSIRTNQMIQKRAGVKL